jgi:SRSO17 transposase
MIERQLARAGLIGPGDRKSVQPMAERLAPGDYDQLHHFVAAGVWDAAPLEKELLVQADKLVGGSDAVLVIDDTAVPKKGKHTDIVDLLGRDVSLPEQRFQAA